MVTPLKALVVGLCGALLFGFWTIKLMIDGDSQYTVADVVVIEGVLDRAEFWSNRGADTLQVWLRGQPLPFRGLSVHFPYYYDKAVLATLAVGVPMRIGILRTEQVSPRIDRFQGQEFRNICSLEINGHTALSLADYNRGSASNAAVGRYVAPSLLLLSLGLLLGGIYAQRRRNL